ncbi:MAG TPA: hypothetical protein VJO53_14690 [Candidatus Acidoferrales bacterium]|nr:hypothetical protein [Candidatus Acidoferrales bacterium]
MPTQSKTPVADPAIVPVESPSGPANAPAAPASPFGLNNETLPDRLQEALRRLVHQFSTESELSRRQEIRRIKQAHQFWRGLQYLWWNERDQNWHLPFEQKLLDNSSIDRMPRYEFVTNIYQAFGLSLVSVLSQDVPRVRFFPSSAQAEEDVAAAKAATEVAGLVERNNRIGNLIVEEAFNLWTGGKVGAYVRFVVDGQRFGFHPETEIGLREVKLGSDMYVCPDCGAETPATPIARHSERSDRTHLVRPEGTSGHAVEESLFDAAPDADEASFSQKTAGASSRTPQNPSVEGRGFSLAENDGREAPSSLPQAAAQAESPEPQLSCPQCGALLTEEDFVAAESVTVPAAETRLRVPNGQEVITIVGGLELKTPPWANEMHEYPYIQWNMEVHQARLRAAYPHAADKIGPPVASGSQEYERLARLAQSQGGPLTEGGDFNINLITFQRTWLRPWAFFALDDKSLRDELLKMFPDGAYVAFAGDAYCESRNENMDDHWRVLHALPGDGSSGRPALGDSLISVQERFNTLSNLQIETYEYGIPPIYADSEVLDFDALQSQTTEPGAHYPARAKPGQSLGAGFFQPAPAEVPPDLAQHAANLMGPIAQFLTGAFPALFGGSMANTDTAAGYSMARDQAMGRIGLVWRRMKFFHADIMLLAVDCFRQNRPSDIEVTLLGAGAAFESKWIRLADLKGNLFSYPETDEQYPTLWSQQRAVLLQLMGNPDPQIQAVLGHPENMALIKRMIGLEGFVIPDEESRTKQYREIAQLVAESPVVVRSDNPNATSIARHSERTATGSGSAFAGSANASTHGVEESLFGTDSRLAAASENRRQDAGAANVPPSNIVIPSGGPTGFPAPVSGAPGPQFEGTAFAPRSAGFPSANFPASSALDLMLPSIMPDEFADNHATELEICMRWFSSDAGQVAKIEAPAGYANVRAHAMFHREYLLKQQRQAAQAAQAPPSPAQSGAPPLRS